MQPRNAATHSAEFTPRGGASHPHSSPGDIPMCLHFETSGDGRFVRSTFCLPIPAIRGYPPPDHNDHNIYWVSEGPITMRSQFLLDLSDSTCTKPNIHAASRNFKLVILTVFPPRSQLLKDLACRSCQIPIPFWPKCFLPALRY